MAQEEEAALLKPFREEAEMGQIVEVSEIKASYERAVGHAIGGSQIYYVLRRNGWRKDIPLAELKKISTMFG